MKTTAVALATFSCLMLGPLCVHGATLAVDCTGGGDYLSIQEAVDAAASGDTILVAPCVYEDRVDVVDKVLFLQGSGSDVTEIRWSGEYEAISISTPPAAHEVVGEISGLTVVREPARMPAVHWDRGALHIVGCVVRGGALSGGWESPPASVHVRDSDLESVTIHGSGRYSDIYNSVVGTVTLSGYCLYSGAYWHHWLTSEGSEYGTLNLGLTIAHLSDDAVGSLDMSELASCTAENTWFGEIESQCSSLNLRACEVAGGVSVWGTTNLNQYDCGGAKFHQSLFHGDVTVDVDLAGYYAGYGWARMLHNTFLGSLTCRYDGGGEGVNLQTYVRGNIVLGSTEVSGDAINEYMPVAISHNDFVGGSTLPTHIDSVFANISTDPLFCDGGAWDYTLEECSPCAGSAHDGGDMGAFGVGCDCSTMVEEISWGRIKSLYR